MKQAKYIVICGPELVDADSRILGVLNSSRQELMDWFDDLSVSLHVLPEAKMGANDVRNLVSTVIDNGFPAVFVTRYEHTVSEFANAVADGRISNEDLLVKLVHYDEFKLLVTCHRMDKTNQYLDNWPFGILS